MKLGLVLLSFTIWPFVVLADETTVPKSCACELTHTSSEQMLLIRGCREVLLKKDGKPVHYVYDCSQNFSCEITLPRPPENSICKCIGYENKISCERVSFEEWISATGEIPVVAKKKRDFELPGQLGNIVENLEYQVSKIDKQLSRSTKLSDEKFFLTSQKVAYRWRLSDNAKFQNKSLPFGISECEFSLSRSGQFKFEFTIPIGHRSRDDRKESDRKVKDTKETSPRSPAATPSGSAVKSD